MSYEALLQTPVTYWAAAAPDGFGGFTYAAPVPLLVRWQDKRDTFQDAQGEEFISDAIVYTSTALLENGWMFRGVSVLTDPQAQAGAYRIRRIQLSQSPGGDIVVNKNILG